MLLHLSSLTAPGLCKPKTLTLSFLLAGTNACFWMTPQGLSRAEKNKASTPRLMDSSFSDSFSSQLPESQTQVIDMCDLSVHESAKTMFLQLWLES